MTIACHPQRPTARRLVRGALRRDPEDRWAAAFGRIAGYSFAVAVVTGIPLLPFFRPSMATVLYHGSYRLLDGATMSQAYRSVLAISFDVRGGLTNMAGRDGSFGVTDGVPGLVRLRRDAGDLRVGMAHLGQRVKLVNARGRLCRVGAEQGERILGAQLVPHRLDLDGGIDQAGVPEQRDHLTEDANRPPGLGRLPEHGADRLPEPSGIGPIGDHEAAYRLACVKRKVRTAR